jgi:serine/threonine protein kinase
MEYADNGTLRNYLKECFKNLTWSDKFNLALQIAYAVSCLHDEDILHRDLVTHLYFIILSIIYI